MDWIELLTLRIGRDFRRRTSTKTLLPTVPVYRPKFWDRITVRPGIEWTVRTWGVETEDGEFYLVVLPALWSQLRGVLQNVTVALWPVNLSKPYRGHLLIDSAPKVAKPATNRWVALFGNQVRPTCGTFDEGVDPETPWPAATFEELLNAAFRDRVISDLGHPVLQSIGR